MSLLSFVSSMMWCNNAPFCPEKFITVQAKRRHERICPYTQSLCGVCPCVHQPWHTYSLIALHQHLNEVHGFGISEIPHHFIQMAGESQRAKEGRHMFWFDGLFAPVNTERPFFILTKFDGFLFHLAGAVKETSQLELTGYGSGVRQEFLVIKPAFLGVEGITGKYRFRMEFFDPQDPDKYSDVLAYPNGEEWNYHGHGVFGEEVGLPMSEAMQYMQTQELYVVAIFERKKSNEWRQELGPLSAFFDM